MPLFDHEGELLCFEARGRLARRQALPEDVLAVRCGRDAAALLRASGELLRWSAEAGFTTIKRLPLKRAPLSAALSEGGRAVAVLGADNNLRVFDDAGPRHLREPDELDRYGALHLSRGGDQLGYSYTTGAWVSWETGIDGPATEGWVVLDARGDVLRGDFDWPSGRQRASPKLGLLWSPALDWVLTSYYADELTPEQAELATRRPIELELSWYAPQRQPPDDRWQTEYEDTLEADNFVGLIDPCEYLDAPGGRGAALLDADGQLLVLDIARRQRTPHEALTGLARASWVGTDTLALLDRAGGCRLVELNTLPWEPLRPTRLHA